jgi:aspartate/glutamate/aspartate-prephenate aminotransferase
MAHVVAAAAPEVDQTLNPLVAGLKVSKTMALTDLARSMKESGIDVRGGGCMIDQGRGGKEVG